MVQTSLALIRTYLFLPYQHICSSDLKTRNVLYMYSVRLLGNILGGGSLLGARGGTNFSGSNKNLSLSSLPAHL